MIMEPEVKLRKAAMLLTVVLVLQLLWSGARLMLLSDPEMKVPAEASLKVDGVLFGSPQDKVLPDDLVTRPVFWPGRQVHVPPSETVEIEVKDSRRSNGAIDKLELLGIYAGAGSAGIIVSYNGERRRLKKGESLDGWEFTMNSADSVIFENGEETKVFDLEHAIPNSGPKTRLAPKAKFGQSPKADVKPKESSNND